MEKINSANFSLVDLQYLQEITDASSASMLEIIDVFLQLVPLELNQIRLLLEKQAVAELEVAVHKLKPKYHYVGVGRLDACWLLLEGNIRKKKWAACSTILEKAEHTTHAVILELQKVKDNLHQSLQVLV